MSAPADASVIVKGQQMLSNYVWLEVVGTVVALALYLWLILRGTWKQRDESKFTWSSRASREK